MAPDSPFLDEPEKFKNYRQEFVKKLSTVPQPEPVLLMAHELQKVTFEIAYETINDKIETFEKIGGLTLYYSKQ